MEVVGDAMPLAAMSLRGGGGVMLPREDEGAMPSSSWRVGAKPTEECDVVARLHGDRCCEGVIHDKLKSPCEACYCGGLGAVKATW